MAQNSVAVLISGRGSNLKSLVEATQAPSFPGKIKLVISNRPGAPGLEIAKKAGIETLTLDHTTYGNGEEGRAAFDEALQDRLTKAEVEFVCLAGFMRLLTATFVRTWRGKLLNIHPSLLPAFKGLNVHERMIEQGIKIAGCTVHFVNPEVDDGPIIGQAAVPVLPGDTPETLADRILQEEHRLYPACLKLVLEGKARISAGGVVKLPELECDVLSLHNPTFE